MSGCLPTQSLHPIPYSPEAYSLSRIPGHDLPMSPSQETTFSLIPTQAPSFLRDPDPYPISDPRDFLPVCLSESSHPHCRRNQNYLDILRLLSLGDRQLSAFDISLRFTHLFWFGDLNYRLDMDIQVRAGGWAGGQMGSHLRLWLRGTAFSLCVPTPGDPELYQQKGV